MNDGIAKRIKERRTELKITQTQVQQETGISTGNLSCIESGKYLPSATALIELSRILDCSVDWILTGESSVSKNTELLDIEEKELVNGFRELSDDDKEELLSIMRLKLRKVKKEKTLNAKSSALTDTDKANMAG